MLTIGLGHYLALASTLFTLGVFGIFLNRKNVIVILMCVELMLLAVNINLVAFSVFQGNVVGQVFAMLVLTVAAAGRLKNPAVLEQQVKRMLADEKANSLPYGAQRRLEIARALATQLTQEELDAIRPDLDGNAIMTILGIGPGPVIGRAYKFLLEMGPVGPGSRKWLPRETAPLWDILMQHPNYDAFWQTQSLEPRLTRVTVPTLNVAGWYDQEDFRGPLRIYELLEQRDTKNQNFLVVGPWNHGGWTRDGTALGPIAFGSDTAAYFRDQVQAPFFAYFLKDKGTRDFPEALTFEAGRNEWRRWDAWPPTPRTERMALHFGPHEALTLAPAKVT